MENCILKYKTKLKRVVVHLRPTEPWIKIPLNQRWITREKILNYKAHRERPLIGFFFVLWNYTWTQHGWVGTTTATDRDFLLINQYTRRRRRGACGNWEAIPKVHRYQSTLLLRDVNENEDFSISYHISIIYPRWPY